MMNVLRAVFVMVSLLGFLTVFPAQADDAYLEADEAVGDILFDYEYGTDFATYTVNENGFVSITFASNMPNELYSEVLNRLKNHDKIRGVLAGKSGPPCRAW